jgi:hypothetical protein
MKNSILQGGDSYPSCLVGMKGGQLRSRPVGSEVRRKRRNDSAVKPRGFKKEAQLRRQGFFIQKEFNV